MLGDEFPEEGIPGHASSEEWAWRLQRRLRELGVSFEAEGSATRITLPGGAIVEVVEAGEGYGLAATIPLPGGGDPEAADAAWEALRLMASLGVELSYELDTSLPGYPMLRVTAAFRDPHALSEKLLSALQALQSRQHAKPA
jgi:hypothetical protein